MELLRKNIKIIIDILLIILLPFLMIEIVTGQVIHELLGTSLLILFIVHHLLNLNWWRNFYKGKYDPSRFLNTTVDLLLLFDMIALGISGIMMSGYVFSFLPITSGLIQARQIHLLASHWGLILMSLHLGEHFKRFLSLGKHRQLLKRFCVKN